MPPVVGQISTSFLSCDTIAALKARCVETNSVTATATGKTEQELTPPVARPQSPHPEFRRVHKARAVTFLTVHLADKKAADCDADGKEIRSFAAPGLWSAARLKHGDMVICSVCSGGINDLNKCPGPGQMLEATPATNAGWALCVWKNPDLGERPPIQWLDELGGAENGDLQR